MYFARVTYKQTVCQHATVLPLWKVVRQGTCWISETNVIISSCLVLNNEGMQ